MPYKPLFFAKNLRNAKMIANRDYIFSMKIWPLVTFSHKLKHFSAKISQWDRHWNCEKKSIFEIASVFVQITLDGLFLYF